MVRDTIHSSETGRQIGYIENKQAFNLKGKKLYNVDGLNLIDPKTRKWLATYLRRVARIPEPRTISLPLRITNNKRPPYNHSQTAALPRFPPSNLAT
jgi:hypothetical protein